MRQRRLKPLRQQINDLLHLHTGERRGILLLMAVLVLLSGWVVLEQWVIGPSKIDLAPIHTAMEDWKAHQLAVSAKDSIVPEPFPFDPNKIDRSEWLALGFTERQVNGIERYMAKGGRFRVKQDVSRLYSIRPGQYERLAPFILLPDKASTANRTGRGVAEHKRFPERTEPRTDWYDRKERNVLQRVEVNNADSAELVALPGIGPSFAKGILKYRESLGGYYSLDQLAEVYVLQDKPDALVRMRELLFVDTLAVRRIPINSCTVEELALHPYVRWKLAKPLIAYRQQHGPFKKVNDITGCVLIDAEVFRKLAPYLSVE